MARSLAADAPERILGSRMVNLLANGGEEFHDPVMVCSFLPPSPCFILVANRIFD